jgi:uncharacterized protein (DUF924 family)
MTASSAISQGLDRDLTVAKKQFMYLPFQHSEDREDQVRSLALFEKLGIAGWTEYARAHKAIIDRFGRFPHRNAILGRHSSADEIASLSEPMADGMAKSMTVVTPPRAPARVPVR